jgi:5-methylcytosine-specific restriction endonuclease McrA
LNSLYTDKKLSQRKIAEIFSVSPSTIKLALRFFEIKARNKSWKNEELKTGAITPCKQCGKPTYKKGSRIKNQENVFCFQICSHNYQSVTRKKISEKIGWRGQRKYRLWRKAVISRDKNCKKCGSKNNLCAHHVLEAQNFPEKMYDVKNGITLCKTCHIQVYKNHNFQVP